MFVDYANSGIGAGPKFLPICGPPSEKWHFWTSFHRALCHSATDQFCPITPLLTQPRRYSRPLECVCYSMARRSERSSIWSLADPPAAWCLDPLWQLSNQASPNAMRFSASLTMAACAHPLDGRNVRLPHGKVTEPGQQLQRGAVLIFRGRPQQVLVGVLPVGVIWPPLWIAAHEQRFCWR
jgi:hypothetical protein